MTMCAGCGSTLKNDYKTPFKVMDINEILTKYGIEPPGAPPDQSDLPRSLPPAAGAGHPRPAPRADPSGHRSGGDAIDLLRLRAGIRSGNPDEAAALGSRRGEEIKKTGAEIVITSCPFCEFHIMGHTDKPVKNIATVLLEGYREKDRKNGKK